MRETNFQFIIRPVVFYPLCNCNSTAYGEYYVCVCAVVVIIFSVVVAECRCWVSAKICQVQKIARKEKKRQIDKRDILKMLTNSIWKQIVPSSHELFSPLLPVVRFFHTFSLSVFLVPRFEFAALFGISIIFFSDIFNKQIHLSFFDFFLGPFFLEHLFPPFIYIVFFLFFCTGLFVWTLIKFLMKNDVMYNKRCTSYVPILVTKIYQMPLAATQDRVGIVLRFLWCSMLKLLKSSTTFHPTSVFLFAFNVSVLWSNAIHTPLLFDLRYRNVSCE